MIHIVSVNKLVIFYDFFCCQDRKIMRSWGKLEKSNFGRHVNRVRFPRVVGRTANRAAFIPPKISLLNYGECKSLGGILIKLDEIKISRG